MKIKQAPNAAISRSNGNSAQAIQLAHERQRSGVLDQVVATDSGTLLRSQMPERYWATLPETTIIDELVTPPDDAKRTPRIHPTGSRAERRSDPTSRG